MCAIYVCTFRDSNKAETKCGVFMLFRVPVVCTCYLLALLVPVVGTCCLLALLASCFCIMVQVVVGSQWI